MRKDHLPLAAGNAFPNEAQEAIGRLCHEGALLAQRAPSCADLPENAWRFPHHAVL